MTAATVTARNLCTKVLSWLAVATLCGACDSKASTEPEAIPVRAQAATHRPAPRIKPQTPAPTAAPLSRIETYGSVTPVDNTKLLPDPTRPMRVAFDVFTKPESADKVNGGLEKLARYINLLAEANVNARNAELVAVIHGDAAFAVLDQDAFRQRFGVDNPNLELLAKLTRAGFEIEVCGQALAHRNIQPDQVDSTAEVVLSALTALTALSQDHYYVERLG